MHWTYFGHILARVKPLGFASFSQAPPPTTHNNKDERSLLLLGFTSLFAFEVQQSHMDTETQVNLSNHTLFMFQLLKYGQMNIVMLFSLCFITVQYA
jgi:hypothetical protein